MGIGHVDRAGRDSFALDLIETMRPIVDRIVLGILSEPLHPDWFREDKEGIVSLSPPITHRVLAEVHSQAIEIVKHLFTILELLHKINRTKRETVS
jgi:CRISPR/Cas system-associated endonuclease Cas1